MSVTDTELEEAEKEIFLYVFAGGDWSDVALLPEGQAKAVAAEVLAPFVWCQFQRNRAQYVTASGEATKQATSYGVVTTNRIVRVWNEGVVAGRALMERYGDLIHAELPNLRLIAGIKY